MTCYICGNPTCVDECIPKVINTNVSKKQIKAAWDWINKAHTDICYVSDEDIINIYLAMKRYEDIS